ncbi:nitroreductase/quinone reductase family protein [Amycolatopsis cihanbeyliensis]|uniref:Deazaflavin-dependent oxidoreductase (Nitroreductase family) n=1 Tax=Amycolatopsis cihanbeyliensis TaxID=1128664 RepID=A0A542DF33_AMYCI|nr:nitroreductase/quinone reductase family protein [Amycolatopsis cihanbeyliensis]TQJ01695.1 deazaflavin-dependent oxidoreductase (nitroreductase family) [Amycolatopsis cihanbeyliensis]
MPNDNQTIDEFRANHGRLSGPLGERRIVLLTTTAASDTPRTTPVEFLHDQQPDGGRRMLLLAADDTGNRPAWHQDLSTHPQVTVETGVFTFHAEAETVPDDEREHLIARAAEADPIWADRQDAADRVIPVVALHPFGGTANAGREGDFLQQIHGAFRHELALIRKEVAAGAGLGAQLRINCLTLCQGLQHHHTSEDDQMYPALEEQHPELAPTLARLRQEHRQIAALLEQLQNAVSATDTDPVTVLAEVERLTTEVEAHLDYEEQQLIPVLNNMTLP